MIIIVQDALKDKNIESGYWSRQDKYSDYILRRTLETYPRDVSGITAVEIETLNRCNNDCSFCPVNRHDDTREFHKMSENMFYNIIEQLEEISYSGEISIFSNNEPLLDNRIYDFIDYAKEKLPNAHHSIYTNGILLTEERFDRLIKSLDTLYIDNYDDNLCLRPNIEEIITKDKYKNIRCEVYVFMRKKHQILDSRGGEAPNRKNIDMPEYTSTCIAPFMQLIIRPDGKISRCCQDALGKTTLGDLGKETLKQIWCGEIYNKFRDDLQNGKRNKINQCKHCDVFGNMAYVNNYWKSKVIGVTVDILWEAIRNGKKIYIYKEDYKSRNLKQILDVHSIKIERVIETEEIEGIFGRDDSFICFLENENEILKMLDINLDLLGKKYIVLDVLADFFDINQYELREEKRKILKEISELSSERKKLYIFGTGSIAERVIKLFDYKEEDIEAFIDNNKNKQGKRFKGKEIIDLTKVDREETENIYINVASSYYEEIQKQILENKVCEKSHIINGYRILKI